jgi:riboflavin synthase
MFTGIIEFLGEVKSVREEGTNRIFEIEAPFDEPIKVDQSIAHDGVCLTVTEIFSKGKTTHYSVTAVEETLQKTHLNQLKPGDLVNIERCLKVGARLDGHFVQGHVDTVGTVRKVEDRDGSWILEFGFKPAYGHLLVDKGSICVNGVSLTVVESHPDWFSVTIIPFTYEHTNFKKLQADDVVNLEFDILAKYLSKWRN